MVKFWIWVIFHFRRATNLSRLSSKAERNPFPQPGNELPSNDNWVPQILDISTFLQFLFYNVLVGNFLFQNISLSVKYVIWQKQTYFPGNLWLARMLGRWTHHECASKADWSHCGQYSNIYRPLPAIWITTDWLIYASTCNISKRDIKRNEQVFLWNAQNIHNNQMCIKTKSAKYKVSMFEKIIKSAKYKHYIETKSNLKVSTLRT